MRTCLILSTYLPPRLEVGGKRAHRFARYLPEHGWRPIVWTAPLHGGETLDLTGGAPLPPEVRVRRDLYPRWWRKRSGAFSDGSANEPIDEANDERRTSTRQRLAGMLQLPFGNDLFLLPHVARRVRRVAHRERPDLIMASSSPYSTLLLGAVARAMTGAPLVLDLRDPWSMNFLQRRKSAWLRRAEADIERSLLTRAQRVTLTSEACAEAYRARYPELGADHFRTIYNAFDPAQRPPTQKPSQGPLTLVHFGNCYGERRLDAILRAIDVLRVQQGWTPEDVRVINLGRVDARDLELAARLGVEGFLEYRPFSRYEEGLATLASVDLQLLVAYGRETIYVPAKLFDYMLSGAPILCIAPPSELTQLVAQTGTGVSVEPGDTASIVRTIVRAAEARSNGAPLCHRDEAAVQRFAAPETARQLARLMDEVVAGRRPDGRRVERPRSSFVTASAGS